MAQISPGRSAHPGPGDLPELFWATAAIAPSRSNRMARELVIALVERQVVAHPEYTSPSTALGLAAPSGPRTDIESLCRRRHLTRALAGVPGTCVLILFGAGVVAKIVLSRGAAGSYLAINLTWGLGVTMGCYVAGGISGAHLNPAVTVALAVRRGFPWRKVPIYTAAQIAGAFLAAAIVYLTYREAFAAFDGGTRQVLGELGTGGIFATYPRPFLSTFPGGFIDQVVGTAILMAGIFAISDARNVPPPAGLAPLLVGLLVVAIGAAFGFNSGYAINPARDIGPRLFTAVGDGASRSSARGTLLGGGASSAVRGRRVGVGLRAAGSASRQSPVRNSAKALPSSRRRHRGAPSPIAIARRCRPSAPGLDDQLRRRPMSRPPSSPRR